MNLRYIEDSHHHSQQDSSNYISSFVLTLVLIEGGRKIRMAGSFVLAAVADTDNWGLVQRRAELALEDSLAAGADNGVGSSQEGKELALPFEDRLVRMGPELEGSFQAQRYQEQELKSISVVLELAGSVTSLEIADSIDCC